MKKTFLMVAAVAAMLIATGFTACKPNSKPKEIDIYVSGSERNGTKVVAKVWKNGKELYELTDGSKSAVANSVFVVGGDVYSAVQALRTTAHTGSPRYGKTTKSSIPLPTALIVAKPTPYS